MKIYGDNITEKNLTPLDAWSFGHVAFGVLSGIIAILIMWKIKEYIPGVEVGLGVMIIVAFVGIGWEYIENGIFKRYNVFKRFVLFRKIFAPDRFTVDSWSNCLSDVVCVLIGMGTVLPYGYIFYPQANILISFGIFNFMGVLLMFIKAIVKSEKKKKDGR